VAAADLGIEDAALNIEEEDRDRVGVVIGSAVGGLEFGEEQVAAYMQHGPKKVSPYLSIIVFAGAVSSEVSLHLGVKGPTITVSTGCSAGSDAIGYAFRNIKEGKADVMVAGGTDAPLRPVIFVSFCAINALSTRNDAPQKASRPFDLKRDGFVMSEGAAILILEELQHALKRGAKIYGEVVGYAATGDAFHMTRPSPDGEEAARAMQLALEEAQVKPEEVDYINAHGSSTPLNDKTETMVIKNIFGDHAYRLAVNSTKSLLGHPIGASGAIELGACLLSIQTGMLHPTINYEFFDPDCDLDYVPNVARPARVKVAASNSFGFGGKNATLVVRRFEG
jgi:3-oxoacyl-[acyl-carrier-protein] synthase II